jgi:hypothetical protein
VGDVIRLADGGLIAVLEHVQREVAEVLKTEPSAVVVDLSAQEAVTTTSLAALLWVRQVCLGRAIPVGLSSPSNAWLDVLLRANLLQRGESEEGRRRAAFAVMWPPLTKASQCGTR